MTPLAKLNELAALEKGWDGDDAEPISRRTVEAASRWWPPWRGGNEPNLP